jgi:hypothetical protein
LGRARIALFRIGIIIFGLDMNQRAKFPRSADQTSRCSICGREETLTRHHLIPRTRHHNKKNKRDFDRAAVREVVGICRPCHSQIHEVFSEKELERDFNTIEKLKNHPEIAKFASWIRNKPRGFRCGHARLIRGQ